MNENERISKEDWAKLQAERMELLNENNSLKCRIWEKERIIKNLHICVESLLDTIEEGRK